MLPGKAVVLRDALKVLGIRVNAAGTDIWWNVRNMHTSTAKRKSIVNQNDIASLRNLIGSGKAIVTLFLMQALNFPWRIVCPDNLSPAQILITTMIMQPQNPRERSGCVCRAQKDRLGPWAARQLPRQLFNVQPVVLVLRIDTNFRGLAIIDRSYALPCSLSGRRPPCVDAVPFS